MEKFVGVISNEEIIQEIKALEEDVRAFLEAAGKFSSQVKEILWWHVPKDFAAPLGEDEEGVLIVTKNGSIISLKKKKTTDTTLDGVYKSVVHLLQGNVKIHDVDRAEKLLEKFKEAVEKLEREVIG